MPPLPPFTGAGSIPAGEVEAVALGEREGWQALRSLQADPTCDVLRYTKSDGDPARGVAAEREADANLAALPVLWSNLTEREVRAFGGVDFASGDRRFEFFTDVEIFNTDLIRFPAGAGDVWQVTSAYYDAHLGQSIAFCRIAKGSA